jgi:hypothetical protein|tara:strand:- start:398 stop:712 length:315 start_codon:yes stop_codon:yes gene_type:complete
MTIQTTAVTNSATTVYTSTNNTAITYMELTNVSGGALTVDIHVIPSGDSLSNTNIIAKTLSIATLDSYQLYTGGEKLLLANGDTVQVTANAATGINSVVSFTSI